jgi:hypothetical protein
MLENSECAGGDDLLKIVTNVHHGLAINWRKHCRNCADSDLRRIVGVRRSSGALNQEHGDACHIRQFHSWPRAPMIASSRPGESVTTKLRQLTRPAFLGLFAITFFIPVALAQSSTAAPIYQITPLLSKITFGVKVSLSIEGTFDKWNANLSFKSPNVSTGVLDIRSEGRQTTPASTGRPSGKSACSD